MKKIVVFTILAFASITTAVAQQEKPKKEFLLTLSENTVQLSPGESKEIIVNLVRSKAFSKSKAKLGLSSALPEGVTFTYEPGEGVIESSTAKITVSTSTKPGTYTVLPNCIMNNTSKGTMLKLVIGNGPQSLSGK